MYLGVITNMNKLAQRIHIGGSTTKPFTDNYFFSHFSSAFIAIPLPGHKGSDRGFYGRVGKGYGRGGGWTPEVKV